MTLEEHLNVLRFVSNEVHARTDVDGQTYDRKGGHLFCAKLKMCDINKHIMHISNIFEIFEKDG